MTGQYSETIRVLVGNHCYMKVIDVLYRSRSREVNKGHQMFWYEAKCRSESTVKKLLLLNVFLIESSFSEQRGQKKEGRPSKFEILGVLKKWTDAPSSFYVMSASSSQISAAVNLVWRVSSWPGESPRAKSISPLLHTSHRMISAAQLKGTKGPADRP